MNLKGMNKEKIEKIEVERFNRPAMLNVDFDAISEEMKRAEGSMKEFFKRLEEEAAKYQHDMDMCIICEMAVQWLKEQEQGKTYEQGLADAWELAKKIVVSKEKGGYSATEVCEIFGMSAFQIFERFTPEEALAKIEAYEKEKEIKVGDEVIIEDEKILVTKVTKGEPCTTIDGIRNDGDVICYSARQFEKTGKHIDIESLLRQIGE